MLGGGQLCPPRRGIRSILAAMTDLQRIVAALKGDGFDIETVEDGALVKTTGGRVALFAQHQEEGVLVRLHLDLDLYVDKDALSEVLLGVNMLNSSLDHGCLVLEPVDEDDDDEDEPEPEGEEASNLTFAVLGRSTLVLDDLGKAEIARLTRHLRRFEAEVAEAVERTLHGSGGLKA